MFINSDDAKMTTWECSVCWQVIEEHRKADIRKHRISHIRENDWAKLEWAFPFIKLKSNVPFSRKSVSRSKTQHWLNEQTEQPTALTTSAQNSIGDSPCTSFESPGSNFRLVILSFSVSAASSVPSIDSFIHLARITGSAYKSRGTMSPLQFPRIIHVQFYSVISWYSLSREWRMSMRIFQKIIIKGCLIGPNLLLKLSRERWILLKLFGKENFSVDESSPDGSQKKTGSKLESPVPTPESSKPRRSLYKCDFCDFKGKRDGIVRHVKFDHKEKLDNWRTKQSDVLHLPCDQCDQFFASMDDRDAHFKTKHLKPESIIRGTPGGTKRQASEMVDTRNMSPADSVRLFVRKKLEKRDSRSKLAELVQRVHFWNIGFECERGGRSKSRCDFNLPKQ